MINDSLDWARGFLYKLGQAYFTNWGSFVYYKSEQTLLQIGVATILQTGESAVANCGNCYYKIKQLLQIGEKFLQIGAGITN